MFGQAKDARQAIPGATPDEAWRALAAALPALTTKAGWFTGRRQVEWTGPGSGWTWVQILTAWIDDAGDGSAVLRITSRPRYGRSYGAPSLRRRVLGTLVPAVEAALVHRLTLPPAPDSGRDEVHWWDGQAWIPEPAAAGGA